MSASKLWELVRDVEVGMLTTVDSQGQLRARPLATIREDGVQELLFFTEVASGKVTEVQKQSRVSLTYSQPKKNEYVSLSGTAELVTDRAMVKRLWKPIHKAWYPNGPDDPNLGVIRVVADQAEYWDGPSGTLVNLLGIAKALASGEPYRPGENEKLRVGAGR